MSERDQELEIEALEADFPLLAGKAFDLAFKESQSLGQTIFVAEDGVIIEISPNGLRRPIRKIERPTRVQIGQKIRLR